MSYKSARVGGLITLFVFLSSISVPAIASAETPNPNGAFNVIVSPTSQNLEVKPGGTVSETIQFKNQGIATEHIKMSVMKFRSDNLSGLPVLANPGPNDTYISWVKFSANTFDAQPGVWTSVKLTISPPKTSAFGYYYAIVFSRNQTQIQSHVANLIGSVASLVLLDVQAPGEVRRAEIAQFGTDRNVYEFLPANFSIKMRNTGNVHVAPRGNIFITQGGKSIAMLDVNMVGGNVLPSSNRVFTAQWTDGAPSYQKKTSNGNTVMNSQDKPVTTLVWKNLSFGKLRFGKYNAKLVMVYNDGEGDTSSQANLSFWVIPWRLLIVCIVALILILGGLWALIIKPARRRFGGNGRGNVRFR